MTKERAAVETRGIEGFADIVAHLDGLIEAAWTSGVDPRLPRQAASIRHRILLIQGYLTGDPSPGTPRPTPRATSVRDNDDFLRQFGAIVDGARAAALSSTLTHYMHNARQRLTYGWGGRENRLASRRSPTPGARAHLRCKDQDIPADIADTSAFGLGLVSDSSVEPNQVVEAVITDPSGKSRTYLCLAIHCNPHGDRFFLGLEIFTTRL
jgi:hypothetical protein